MTFSYPEITETERRAPKGKFRTAAVFSYGEPVFYLMGDYDTLEEARGHAESLDEGPYMGPSVADDTGAIVYPEGSTYRVPEVTTSAGSR